MQPRLTLVALFAFAGAAVPSAALLLDSASEPRARSSRSPVAAAVEPVAARRASLPPLRSAGRFFLRETARKLDGDWGGSWNSLHPFHQRIAPRETFVRCETATPFAAPLKSLRLIGVRAGPVRIAGLRRLVPGVAVTVAVELTWYGPRDPISFRHTFHLAAVHGRWRWLLSPQRYRLYLDHACLARPGNAA